MPDLQGAGLQSFLRMANLFGPQPDDTAAYQAMPPELPLQQPQQPQQPYIDENVTADTVPPPSTLDLFKQNVLNPPQDQHITYPKNTNAGLIEAMKIAAEPSPL